jgi:DNA-directed RNA polymerase beta' subunit
MRPTIIKVKTQQINNENYVLITQEEYTKLRQRIDEGFTYAQEKDNKIECLEDELRQAQIELETYKTFFKNMQKLLDKQ